ncbi:hypothetical protein FQA47_005884 [Oryzias melastigma]|nr:hypothetical protein FQA47_005884 [Oryzias melastigma]
MCPLTPDDRSSSSDESKSEKPSCPPATSKLQIEAKKCSGMILKLRKMLGAGGSQKRPRYQAVSASGTVFDSSQTEREDASCDGTLRRTPKALHRWRKIGGFTRALRPSSSRSLKNQRSLLKIKYCPYLSACHSAEHRRRWVLRSAVQRARGAMRLYYPDLVGKKIHHLYEEDDKSEVWYRGEVLRVHEAHTNPMKTIFEVRYDSEPEWKYYLELLMDYKKGWLKIED